MTLRPHRNRDRLLELAAQCESSPTADTALSYQICIALGWAWTEDRTGEPGWHGLYMRGDFPDVTDNILQAEYLVPTKPVEYMPPGRWWWSVETLGLSATVSYENGESGVIETEAKGATPALALCAAALLARAEVLQWENPRG